MLVVIRVDGNSALYYFLTENSSSEFALYYLYKIIQLHNYNMIHFIIFFQDIFKQYSLGGEGEISTF